MMSYELDANTLVLDLPNATIPMTVTLNSTAPGRKLEFSTNGGQDFVAGKVDVTLTTLLMVAVLTPITHIRATGTAGDKLHIVL